MSLRVVEDSVPQAAEKAGRVPPAAEKASRAPPAAEKASRAPQGGTARQAPRGTTPLLVMLPGAGHGADDFVRAGFIAELRERNLQVDVLAVDAHSHFYLDKSIVTRLHEEVIAPALVARPAPASLWLLGISLGGMGASLYARAHPGTVAGLVLLAPFFAVRGTIAEVTRAGGLAQWQPGAVAADDEERLLLQWLKAYRADMPGDSSAGLADAVPAIRLGYGTNDRYAPASSLLEARLPAAQVATVAGGHDWDTWIVLWRQLLDRGLFAGSEKELAACPK